MRLLSWNVLADAYIDTDYYPLCELELLRSGARLERVVEIIVNDPAELITLQEADEDLAHALRASLPNHHILHARKLGRPEGILLAASREFNLVAEHVFEHQDELSPGGEYSGNVSPVMQLSGPQDLILTSAHLRWAMGSPESDHRGLLQLRSLLNHLGTQTPVILTGDTNDEPNGPTRIALAAAGFTEYQNPDYTNVVDGDRKATLDVIAARGLELTFLENPFAAIAPLPNRMCPSDHIPLLAQF